MILLTLWFCSTILVIVSAAHWLPIPIQIAMLPIACTAILVCVQQMYHDPCFRVPFWATPTRLRSLSEIEDPPPAPVYHYARESLIMGLFFWMNIRCVSIGCGPLLVLFNKMPFGSIPHSW